VSPTEFIVELSLKASEELIEVFFVVALDFPVDDIFGRLSSCVTQDGALACASPGPPRSHSSRRPSSQHCFDIHNHKNKHPFLNREIDDEIHALKKAVRERSSGGEVSTTPSAPLFCGETMKIFGMSQKEAWLFLNPSRNEHFESVSNRLLRHSSGSHCNSWQNNGGR
jgi:hypothetical protein